MHNQSIIIHTVRVTYHIYTFISIRYTYKCAVLLFSKIYIKHIYTVFTIVSVCVFSCDSNWYPIVLYKCFCCFLKWVFKYFWAVDFIYYHNGGRSIDCSICSSVHCSYHSFIHVKDNSVKYVVHQSSLPWK